MVLNTTLFTNVDEIFMDALLQSPAYQNPLLLSYENNRITTIGQRFFMVNTSIQTISLPNCSVVPSYCFDRCSSLTNLTLNWSKVTYVGSYAFRSCYSLPSIHEMSACLSIYTYAFQCCSALETISIPNCTTIQTCAFQSCINLSFVDCPAFKPVNATNPSSAFHNCKKLLSVHFSELTILPYGCFEGCNSLQYVVALKCSGIAIRAMSMCYSNSYTVLSWGGAAGAISAYAFQTNRTLLSLYLLGSTVMGLANINAFNSTPISTYTTYTGGVNGSIFVPSSLYATYIASTNWITYSARFVSMTDQEIKDFLSSL